MILAWGEIKRLRTREETHLAVNFTTNVCCDMALITS